MPLSRYPRSMSSDTTTTRALEIAHDLDPEVMRALYEKMLFSRMIEEKMLVLLRQGKVSKWFAGIGQEAIAVGATLALEKDEMIFPMHRTPTHRSVARKDDRLHKRAR